MGGVIGVKDPYEYSNSVEVEDLLEKKQDLQKLPKVQNTSPRDKIQPVRLHALDVPQIDRHPFQEYRFSKKLGE